MASSLMQQMASMGPSLGQSAGSALQGAGPQQLLSLSPQLLSSAPQTLGQMISSFTGSTAPTTGFPHWVLPLRWAVGGAAGRLRRHRRDRRVQPGGHDQPGRWGVRIWTYPPDAALHLGASAAITVVEPEVSAARASPVVAEPPPAPAAAE